MNDLAGLIADIGPVPEFLSQPDVGPLDGALLFSLSFSVPAYSDSAYAALDVPMPERLGAAVPKRRAEYLAGRVLARAGIRAITGLATLPEIGAGRAPIWPRGVSGSISHCEGRALCLVRAGNTTPVGVDIEKIADERALKAIRDLVVTEAETRLIAEAGLDDPAGLTMLFSAKESLFKAYYGQVGAYFGFEAARLCAPPGPDRLRLRLTSELAPGLPEGAEIVVRYLVRNGSVMTWVVGGAGGAGISPYA